MEFLHKSEITVHSTRIVSSYQPRIMLYYDRTYFHSEKANLFCLNLHVKQMSYTRTKVIKMALPFYISQYHLFVAGTSVR